jgi:hypothetical protein
MCPFENMLKIAEMLKYKMPIGENTFRYEEVNTKSVFDVNVNDVVDSLVTFRLKRELREFTRRFEPKEIKNYYENVYFKQRKVNNCCKTFRNTKIENSSDIEEVCTCSCGSGSKRYLTMPYTSSMREK